jgi:hypothetical protein
MALDGPFVCKSSIKNEKEAQDPVPLGGIRVPRG